MCVLQGTGCPHSVSVCSVRFSQQTATVSPNGISWLDFVAEMEYVSCEVLTGELYIIE
jgi:hypothetical protein